MLIQKEKAFQMGQCTVEVLNKTLAVSVGVKCGYWWNEKLHLSIENMNRPSFLLISVEQLFIKINALT